MRGKKAGPEILCAREKLWLTCAGDSWEEIVFKARLKRSNRTSSISSLIDYTLNQQKSRKPALKAAVWQQPSGGCGTCPCQWEGAASGQEHSIPPACLVHRDGAFLVLADRCSLNCFVWGSLVDVAVENGEKGSRNSQLLPPNGIKLQ